MRKKYKNEIFELLLSSKYGIEKFELRETVVDSLEANILTLKGTPFYFTMRNANDDFDAFDYQYIKYAPNFPLTSIEPETSFIKFQSVINVLKKWLNNNVDEYFEDESIPDLWEEFNTGNKSFNINEIDFDDKSFFSFEEKKQVKLSLNELKLLIQSNLKTSTEEQKIVVARLDYLIEATERLNKFDWKSLSLSSLISISIALSLDTQKGHLLFELFKKVFSIIPLLSSQQL